MLNILVCPVTCDRFIDETTCVEFPACGQKHGFFNTEPVTNHTRILLCVIKISTNANYIPEQSINATSKMSITDLTTINSYITGYLAMRALIGGQSIQGMFHTLYQISFTA